MKKIKKPMPKQLRGETTTNDAPGKEMSGKAGSPEQPSIEFVGTRPADLNPGRSDKGRRTA